MKKTVAIILYLLLCPAFAFAQNLQLAPQWIGSTSPSSNITQLTYGKSVKLSGLTAGLCLKLDANNLIVTAACGVGAATSTEPLMASWFVATSTTATSTFAGNVSVTGNLQAGTLIATATIVDSSLTLCSVIFAGAGGTLSQDNANLCYDDTNNRLGIGTASPLSLLDVASGLYDNASAVMIGADIGAGTRTDATRKFAVISSPHYLSAEQRVLGMTFDNQVSANVINIGGQAGTNQNAATEIRFWTAANNATLDGTQRMTLDSSGNVGIGTASPSQALHVVGNVQLTPTTLSNISEINVVRNDATRLWDLRSDISANLAVTALNAVTLDSINGNGLYFNNAGATKMNIIGSNVGIGTTSPYAKLSVVGPVVAEYFHATSTTANTLGGVILGPNGSSGAPTYAFTNQTNTGFYYTGFSAIVPAIAGVGYSQFVAGGFSVGNNSLMFGTGIGGTDNTFLTYNSANKLTLGSTAGGTNGTLILGTMGIGSTSPNAFLTVSATSSLSNLPIFNAIAVPSAGATTTAMTILSTGNVGIGTANPATLLDISGVTTHRGDILTSANNTNNLGASATRFNNVYTQFLFASGIRADAYNDAANGVSILVHSGTTNSFYDGAGVVTMTMDSGKITNFLGNVGIGTSSPYAKLSVVGETVSTYFTATTTTATSTFAGGVGIGTTTPSTKLEINNSLAFTKEINQTSSSNAVTVDFRTGNYQQINTLTENTTVTLVAPNNKSAVGQLQIRFVMDGVGGYTVTWPASVKWPGGTAPTLTTFAGTSDIIGFWYDGTNYYNNYTMLDVR